MKSMRTGSGSAVSTASTCGRRISSSLKRSIHCSIACTIASHSIRPVLLKRLNLGGNRIKLVGRQAFGLIWIQLIVELQRQLILLQCPALIAEVLEHGGEFQMRNDVIRIEQKGFTV